MGQPTLDGNIIEGVESIGVEKTANLLPLPMPLGDADETEVFDMLGVVTIISVTGTFAESTIAATKAHVTLFEGLIDGNQNTTYDFVSDQTGTVTVKIAGVNTNWEIPGFKCTYEIKLIQGT